MLKRIRRNIHVILIGLLTSVVAAQAAWSLYEQYGSRQVVIAAGSASRESFVIMQALKAVIERYYPRYKIVLHETSGTPENIQELERHEADLATAQADGMASPSIRTVAVLHQDVFQIMAHRGTNIRQFADLKGKRVAVPRGGGQYKTFLNLAGHYGMGESHFTFLGPTDESADLAYVKGDADALFRARALENAPMQRLAQATDSVVVPIEQAAALHLDYPIYTPITIPKGAYSGEPAVPDSDVLTLSSPHFLLARHDTNNQIIRTITEVLMERRQDLQAAVSGSQMAVKPLAANVQPPDPRVGPGTTLHPAAREYYSQNDVSVFSRFADGISGTLGIVLLVLLWSWALRRYRQGVHDETATKYRHRVAALIEEARTAPNGRALSLVRTELVALVTQAVREVPKKRLSEANVQIIRSLAEFGIEFVDSRLCGHDPNDTDPHPNGTPDAENSNQAPPGFSFWRQR
jgi:TRAP transporter TAXI family solute receptor